MENETSNDEPESNIAITESENQTDTSDTQMEKIPDIPAPDYSEGEPRTNVPEEELPLVITHENDTYNVRKRNRRVYTQDIDSIATRTRSKSK